MMKIKYGYCSRISWKVDLEGKNSPFEIFGKDNSKRIRSSLSKIEENNYKFEFENVDVAYIDRFNSVYVPYIESKQGKIYDIKDKVIQNPPHQFPYKALSLYLDDKFLGGVIFSYRDDCIVNGYRVLPKDLEIKIASNVSMLADYHLYKFAIENGKKYVAKGKDRNPYGQNTTIGLALYKLKSGAYPYTTKHPEVDGLNSEFEWDEKSEILLFGLSGSEKPINHAKLLLPVDNPIELAQSKHTAFMHQKFFDIEVIGL